MGLFFTSFFCFFVGRRGRLRKYTDSTRRARQAPAQATLISPASLWRFLPALGSGAIHSHWPCTAHIGGSTPGTKCTRHF
ncbi:hypothetical protein Micbo1qcDRAFT_169006 [Microdochium bolleyi]|uniref:Uncharacterized protein n=1 Tax=Microdochium bolleyi TaxID=196109 RepID=A0A136ILZ7_9PEZI|nr:hypothetical protein Micbo1qcDRAFT_169006 [Microdochium bolleyi]